MFAMDIQITTEPITNGRCARKVLESIGLENVAWAGLRLGGPITSSESRGASRCR